MKRSAVWLLLLIFAVLSAGCAPADPAPSLAARPPVLPEALELPDGYAAEVLVEALIGPTQMVKGPRGELWVAQMAGDENAGMGQVLVIDLERDERLVAVDGLLKPTGIALLGGYLWIATKRDLLRVPLDEEGVAGPAQTVLGNLPFDGRSNGTLTVSPDRKLIFETSGARFGGTPVAGSATLWQVDPAYPDDPEPLATGLKAAYGHAFDAAGRLWVTEIGDDLVNGAAPPDELNLIEVGADYGWPQCYGRRLPALNYGGTQVRCLATRPPVLLFAARAEPVSVTVSPWNEDALLVALRREGAVARVQIAGDGAGLGSEAEAFIDGLARPQHLLVWDDESLLVSDQGTGRIYRIFQE